MLHNSRTRTDSSFIYFLSLLERQRRETFPTVIINQKIFMYNNRVSLFSAGAVRADGLDISDEGESLSKSFRFFEKEKEKIGK